MVTRCRPFLNAVRRVPPSQRAISNILPVKLSRGIPVEKETLPQYEAEQYYPVHVGDVFAGRYHVKGKLGYGAYSTSWLCHDPSVEKYVAVKVSTSLRRFSTATHRELRVYEHLARVESAHSGQSLVRELYDAFELDGPAGKHQCLVQQPMHMTVLELMRLNPKPFNLPLLKITLRRVLSALDFLHTEAQVVHTDLKTDNLMLSLEDRTMPEDFEKIGTKHKTGPFVQPHIYRAPEVIFEMPWGSAVDIWNLACLTWDLFKGEHLFGDIFDSKGGHDPFKHLALMVAVAGPPPGEFIRRSETTKQCFDSSGTWIASDAAAVPSVSLNTLEKRLVGREEEDFIRFMKSMLTWLPEKRKTAKELLDDPWLL